MQNLAKIIDKHTIEVYDLTQFDIDAIMHSGQVFRYFGNGSGYSLVVGNNCAEVFSVGDKAVIKSGDSDYFFNYFDLAADYNEIKRELYVYEKIRPAIDAGGGIRILRGEFVETVISFIISANNNIKRFTKTLNLLAENYGDKLPCGLYAFPTLSQLASLTESDFKTLGCGYRSPYLVKAVRQLQALDPAELSALSVDALKAKLLPLSGVGPKVFSCILLFSNLHRLDIAPIDTWLTKALEMLPESDRSAILNHRYAGVAQQYIFYYLQYLHKGL